VKVLGTDESIILKCVVKEYSVRRQTTEEADSVWQAALLSIVQQAR
jgi:hypothetical protein